MQAPIPGKKPAHSKPETEEVKPNLGENRGKVGGMQPVLIPEHSERLKHLSDVQLPPTRVKLYEVAKEPELLSLDRNSPSDWQKTIIRCLTLSNAAGSLFTSPSNTVNLAVRTLWDHRLLVDTAGRVLSLAVREWMQEQLALYREQFRTGVDVNVTARRKAVQLQDHFDWFVWATAAYFYVSCSSPNPNLDVDLQREFGSLYSQNTESSFVSHPNSSTTSALNFDLPTSMDIWLQGFVFKGVYLRLALETSSEAAVMKAEGRAMDHIASIYQGLQDRLNFSLLFPIRSLVSFGPYLLYGSPVIPSHLSGRFPSPSLDLLPTLRLPRDLLLQLFQAQDTMSELSSSSSPLIPVKPLAFLVNAHMLILQDPTPRFLLYIPCVGSEIKVMQLHSKDVSLPSRTSALLKGEGKGQDLGRYRTDRKVLYGWQFEVHHDPTDVVQRPNRVAAVIFPDSKGDILITANYNSRFRRSAIQPPSKEDRRQALRKVVSTLETTDCIVNHLALGELVRRHRLPLRYLWIVLSKLKDERTAGLVRTDILARTVKKMVHWRCVERKAKSFAEYRDLLTPLLLEVLGASQRPTSDELQFLLFLSRLRIVKEAGKIRNSSEKSFSRVIANSKKKMESFEFLLRHELIKDVLLSANKSPALFLSVSLTQAIQLHCRITITSAVFAKARLDSYSFLNQESILVGDNVATWVLGFEGRFDIREAAYMSLMRAVEQEADMHRTDMEMRPGSRSYISEEDIELLNREEEKLPQNFELVMPSRLYSLDSTSLYRDQYDLPRLSSINDCIANVESLLQDLLSAQGKESVLAELLLIGVTLTYFQEKDLTKCVQMLRKVGQILMQCLTFPAELAVAYHLWLGITNESVSLMEAEQHYVTALLLMTKLYGDPRGRGTSGIPWQLLAASKLSLIAREENRLQDAVLAEEHFDAVYMSTKQYRKLSYAHGRWKHTNTRAEELSMKYPFEHWSTFAPSRYRASISFDDVGAENWEGYFACVLQNHLPMFQAGVHWSNVQYKELLKSTHAQVSGAAHDTKRSIIRPVTLSQILASESDHGVLSLTSLKGSVYIWGSDTHGQLGLSMSPDQPHQDLRLLVPRLLTPLKDEVIREVAIGADHCVAVSVEGRAWSWGDNSKNQLGLGPDAPATVSTPSLIKTINGVMQASCGYTHTLLLTADQQVFSVGDAENGILGHGNLNSVFFPKAIMALKGVKVRHVECGGFHSMALTAEGGLYSWGEAQGGQLGFNLDTVIRKMRDWGLNSSDLYIHTPMRLYGKLASKKVVQVACGEAHTLALTHEGEVFAWGQNSNGQLGLGFNSEAYIPGKGDELSTRYEPKHVRLLSQTTVKKIAASGVYSLFLTSDNLVYACGANDYYKLGLEQTAEDSKDVAVPTKLDVFRGYSISEIACGIDHALAIGVEPQKMLWSWGKNRDGQLGIGSEGQFATPRPVQSLSTAALFKAACGSSTSMVVIGNPGYRRRPGVKEDLELNWGLVLSE